MQIKLNIKPVRVSGFDAIGQARTKDQLVRVISAGHLTAIDQYGSHLISYGAIRGDTVRVYNIEKRRRKIEILAKPKKWTKKKLLANGYEATDVVFTKRVVKTPAHWVGFYYDIPVSLLKMAGLAVAQGPRTFRLISTKK